MKWLPFLLLILVACNNAGKKTDNYSSLKKPLKERTLSYNDTVRMPWSSEPEYDSGYFKGYIPEKLDQLEIPDSTRLFQFFSNIIDKRAIALVDSETLSNPLFIDQKKKTRYDTLRNDKVIILSTYHFGDPAWQRVTINGTLLKGYNGTGNDIMDGEFIDFEPMSFRHFSFNGEIFYYIRAGRFYSFGTSMGNVNWHLIYNVRNKQLNCFETCRFGYMLFGDADGDNQLDYLDFDNSDFCTTVPYSDDVTVRLYSCNDKGQFVLQKDKRGKPYFINGRTGDSFMQDSFNIKESYWPVPIRH